MTVGVFLGGAARLTIGERYIVEAGSEQLAVRGPVSRSPEAVVFVAPRATAQLVEGDDRFVVSCEPTPGRPVALAFLGLVGEGLRQALPPGPTDRDLPA